MRHILAVALVLLATSASVFGQEGGRVGVAFVEAPEQSRGACFAGDLDTAMDCAVEECLATEGVERRDCLRVAWCYPAGWSADIFKMSEEGFHWHDYSCGWRSRAKLEEAVALSCRVEDGLPALAECEAVRLWNDDGEEIAIVE